MLGHSGLGIRHVLGAAQDHRAVDQRAFQVQAVAAVVDPELLPLAGGGVVDVEALAIAAAGAGPVLVDDAATQRGLDAAAAHRLAVGIADHPFADPEIELSLHGLPAGMLPRGGRLLGGRLPGNAGQRHRQQGSTHGTVHGHDRRSWGAMRPPCAEDRPPRTAGGHASAFCPARRRRATIAT